jgi:hypothetical protein
LICFVINKHFFLGVLLLSFVLMGLYIYLLFKLLKSLFVE